VIDIRNEIICKRDCRRKSDVLVRALREMTIQARLKSRRNDGKDRVRRCLPLRTAIALIWLVGIREPRKQVVCPDNGNAHLSIDATYDQ
jgi:hypothetical protein